MKANQTSGRCITTAVLQKAAGAMLPFYHRIATNRAFAAAWTKGVRRGDLGVLERLLREVQLYLPRISSFSTNGIGYFVDFRAPRPVLQYTNGTSLRPGTAQFYFHTGVHRSIARVLVPLYREIVRNKPFARLIVAAVRSGNTGLLTRLVRSKVTTRALKSVTIEFSGFALGFRYAASPYTFYNQFFRELTP
ncbi:hypothetical protein [Paenibacillus mucilaginosus]|uniref:Uncharacterized protein n=1 Tax=Paenibacillus mucilaginosus (strain KNP414) TaxID=1036673 RepID=F8FGU7_PAEMK|nr:hypothetical protein [Paenibacillus mucilaginosus]AEI46248.1 hypothetical protein KNP414_07762 [Paenibacillus mucilaginosus KNP414]MCG7213629.1 hypothetical protein [Paenibacillus mucilaginosus]WDM27563.1 hypothetical protein KCX80_35350 [Paenibacillus mucilaginosus]